MRSAKIPRYLFMFLISALILSGISGADAVPISAQYNEENEGESFGIGGDEDAPSVGNSTTDSNDQRVQGNYGSSRGIERSVERPLALLKRWVTFVYSNAKNAKGSHGTKRPTD